MTKSIAEQIKEILKKKRKKSLDYSIKEGSAYSIMAGMGENYFSTFAIALKASNSEIALLSSIPQLLGSGFQLLSAELVDKFKNRKSVMIASALIQAFVYLPILLIPFIFSSNAAVMLIAFVALYQILGNFISPPWNSLMGDLVPENERGNFFGKRSRLIGITIFLSFITAGIILNRFHDSNVFYGFAIIFIIAMIARLFSAYYFQRMYEPPYEPVNDVKLGFKEFASNLMGSQFGKFTLYLFLINFAVYISNPFFIVYMFRTLNFSYLQFVIVTAANVIVTYTTMYYWGKNSDVFGNMKIMTITGWLIFLNPLLWLLPFGFWYILFVQMWTGFVWAGFQISTTNFIFDNVKPEIRAKMIANFNFLMGIAVFLGATSGGLLVTYVFLSPWIFLSNVQILFMISGLLRLITSSLFLGKFKEMREVAPSESNSLFVDLVAVRPMHKIAAETVVGIYALKNLGKSGVDFGKKIVDESIKLMQREDKRVVEIEEILKNINFERRKQREKEFMELEKEDKKRRKMKEIFKKIKRERNKGKKL